MINSYPLKFLLVAFGTTLYYPLVYSLSKGLLTVGEKVFMKLIPQCTIYFFGSPQDFGMFQRFSELCTHSETNSLCVKLHTGTAKLSFSYPLVSLHKDLLYNINIRGETAPRMISSKHFPKCFVYLATPNIPIPPYLAQGVSVFLERILYVEQGRVFPDYLFLPINGSVNSPNFFNDSIGNSGSYPNSNIGRSKVLLLTSHSEDKLYMFCMPCGFKITEATTEGGGFNLQHHNYNSNEQSHEYGAPSGFPAHHETKNSIRIGSAIDLEEYLGSLDGLDIDKLDALWTELHHSLERFGRVSTNDEIPNYEQQLSATSLLNICGGFDKEILDYIRNIFVNPDSRGKTDLQESCLYKTIFESHNFSGADSTRNIPFQVLQYHKLETNQYYWHNSFYYPDGATIQGFQYSIFVNDKLITSEFNLVALVRPFHTSVWVVLLGTVFLLAFIVKVIRVKSHSLLLIIAVLLEQDIVLKLRKNGSICLIFTVWILATIQLRLAYTCNMYSFLSSVSYPKVPSSLEDLVNNCHLDKYGLFVGQGESEVLNRYIRAKLNEIAKNGTEIKFLSNFKRAYKVLYEHDLQKIWTSKNDSEAEAFEEEFRLNRFAFISLTHPTKAFTSHNPYDIHGNGNGGGGSAGGFGGGQGGGGGMLPPQWEAPIPFESALVATGKYIHFKSDNTSINPSMWLFQGNHDYFTHYFCRDLSALIQTGIYLRWEQLMNAYIERRYIEELNLKLGTSLSSLSSEERNAPTLEFTQVDNYSLRVIWTLYFGGLFVSFLAYSREIIRLNLPKRPKTMYLP